MRVLGLCPLLLLAAAACRDRAAGDVCADLGDDVVVTHSLPDGPDTVTFRELWRVGADGAAHFGFPLPLAISRQGRAAIADFMLSEVFLIEADGTWRGTVARRGAGPGELTSPVAAGWGGDTLIVFDIMRPALVRFAADLSHGGDLRVEPRAVSDITDAGELGWAGVRPDGALLLIPGLELDRDRSIGTERLLRYAPGAREPDTLLAASFSVIATPQGHIAAAGSPRIAGAVTGARSAFGTGDRYLVHVHDGDRLALRICAPAPRSTARLREDERGSVADSSMAEAARMLAAAPPAPVPAAFARLIVGADGSIWVQRDRRSAVPDSDYITGRPGAVVDVFEPDGTFRRTIRLPPRARLQGALGDTIWTYEFSDLDELTLVAYEIGAR